MLQMYTINSFVLIPTLHCSTSETKFQLYIRPITVQALQMPAVLSPLRKKRAFTAKEEESPSVMSKPFEEVPHEIMALTTVAA